MESLLKAEIRELREDIVRLREALNNGIKERVKRLEEKVADARDRVSFLEADFEGHPGVERRQRRPVVSQDRETGKFSLHLSAKQALGALVVAAIVLVGAVFVGSVLAVAQFGTQQHWDRLRQLPDQLDQLGGGGQR